MRKNLTLPETSLEVEQQDEITQQVLKARHEEKDSIPP